MSLWLTDEELIELTGYKRRQEQRLALAEMKIKFRSRPADGFPLVERSQFAGDLADNKRQRPNFDAIPRRA